MHSEGSTDRLGWGRGGGGRPGGWVSLGASPAGQGGQAHLQWHLRRPARFLPELYPTAESEKNHTEHCDGGGEPGEGQEGGGENPDDVEEWVLIRELADNLLLTELSKLNRTASCPAGPTAQPPLSSKISKSSLGEASSDRLGVEMRTGAL